MTALSQREEALQLANEVRVGIAQFKRDTRMLGTRGAAFEVAGVFENRHDDPVLRRARVRHLLKCVPHLGERKIGKCLTAAGIQNFDKRLGDLTPRQCAALALQLRLWVANWGLRAR